MLEPAEPNPWNVGTSEPWTLDQATTYTYNLDHSVASTAFTNATIATPTIAHTYDPYYPRPTTMVDGIGTTSYTYKAAGTNGAGQVATIDGPLTNDTIAYTYDELGRVIQRTINGSANQVDWTFDALGRVTSEENLLGEFTYTYDGVTNRLATVTYPNGQTSTYSYYNDQNDHRLQTIHHQYPNTSTLSKFDYTYDAVGNILTWRQQADSTAVLWRYGYDPADQLTSAVKHATDTNQTVLQRFAYAYDPAGNRTVEQIDDVVTLSAYDNLNRLTSQAPGGPMVIAGTLNEPGTVTISGKPAVVDANNNFSGTVPTITGTNTFTIVARDATGNATTQQYEVDVAGSSKAFAYDANGNLTSDGSRSFEWNAADKLVSVGVGSTATSLTYSGAGMVARRIVEVSNVVVSDVNYVFDRTRRLEERLTGTSDITREFAKGELRTGTPTFYTHDHIGSIDTVTTQTGTAVLRNAYDPFGRTTSSGSGSAASGFAGYRVDPTNDLMIAPYRAYDSSLGRWLTRDPLGAVDGLNRYLYVKGNPIGRIDPLGLKIRCMVAGIREQQVTAVSGCVGNPDGCTSIENVEGQIMPCRPDGGCPERFGFDAFAGVHILVEYRIPPETRNKETPGATMRQHETLHVADFVMLCRDLDDRIRSEGFMTKGLCEAARESFNARLRQEYGNASRDSRYRNDKQWVR